MGPLPRWLRWLPVLGWALLIFYWSGQSELPIDHPRISQLFHGQQHRLAHAAAFGTLALLVRFALGGAPRAALWAWLFATGFGVLDEWHQSFTPGRTPDLEDVLIDMVSAAVAVLVADAFVAAPARDMAGSPSSRDFRPARLLAPVGVALVAMPLLLVLLEWHAPAPAVVRRQAVAVSYAARQVAREAAKEALPERYEQPVARLARGAWHAIRAAGGELRVRLGQPRHWLAVNGPGDLSTRVQGV